MDVKTACKLFRQREHYFSLSDRLFMQNFPLLIKPTAADVKRFNDLIVELNQLKDSKPTRTTDMAGQPPFASVAIEDASKMNHLMHLRNPGIEDSLITYAQHYPVILGGIFLLSSLPFLKFASTVSNVIFVVQNYDTVHQLSDSVNNAYASLKNKLMYKHLPGNFSKVDPNRIIAPVNLHGDLRAFNDPEDWNPIFHAKYLILADLKDNEVQAKAVALGSYNFTHRATKSVEHLDIFESEALASLYLYDFVEDLQGCTPWP